MQSITVAVPTFNRAAWLKGCLQNVLAQDYPNFDVLVLDNASTDDTRAVVEGFQDPRISYERQQQNLGLFRNWKRAVEMSMRRSAYVAVLQDDDRMLPGFLESSARVLDENPSAGYSFGLFRHVDLQGDVLGIQQDADRVPDQELIDGHEYLHRMIAGNGWEIHASTVLMRSEALRTFGVFDAPHSDHTHDFNLYLRLAHHYDIANVRREIAEVRVHDGQYTERNFRAQDATGHLALMTEQIDALGYLMASPHAAEPAYRHWLAERLLSINAYRSEMTQALVPSFGLSWEDKVALAAEEIAAVVPEGEMLGLIDEFKWGSIDLRNREVLRFCGDGPPTDERAALEELERLQTAGAGFLVVGWPAFWWLDFYGGLRERLKEQCRCLARNSRIRLFDLRT